MANSTSSTAAANLFCVVYRKGGKANFQWLPTLAMSKAEAIEAKSATERMGYKALLYRYSDLVAIGLPETYE